MRALASHQYGPGSIPGVDAVCGQCESTRLPSMWPQGGGGGGVGWVLGFSFAGYVPLASQSPCLIIVYFVASYRPHLSHFLGKCNFRDPN